MSDGRDRDWIPLYDRDLPRRPEPITEGFE